ncbi:hypothetical protein MMC19_002442 [Ptychographa xylographoides]|nr:hypothetical protein [Ptychographa xylographoides]
MSATSYRAAHQWLLDLLERKGPYDGVMTFSQGGSLASSLLLYHAMVTPHLPPPFKVAVFICSGIPLVALEDLGIPVPQKARDLDESSRQALFAQADTEAILARGADRWIGLEAPGYDATAPVKETDVSGLDFTKFSNEFRIKIPTVHIYGARDPRRPASLQLAQFCIKENRRVFDHGDGHEIPRRRDVSAKIAELIEWTVVKIKQ